MRLQLECGMEVSDSGRGVAGTRSSQALGVDIKTLWKQSVKNCSLFLSLSSSVMTGTLSGWLAHKKVLFEAYTSMYMLEPTEKVALCILL